ncbi:MAG: hypothetical protein A2792_19735 [Sphingomonadales bacterium RIFCSPHIGHO2_01_FULL_65_20]|nr:MAG: hypothetical protein A2792_19735 [Sphingomonadales bacterium RIFCSPHIGHO2_01_FULL_65_20]
MLPLILALMLQSGVSASADQSAVQPAPGTQQTAAETVELWQGLKTGMTPQEAAATLSAVEGVRKVKVVNDRKPNDPRRIEVSFTGSGYVVAGVPFQIGAIFKAARLDKALIQSGELCASVFPEAFTPIRDGLNKKYGKPLFEEKDLDELAILEALDESSRLGQPVSRVMGFASGKVAAYVDVTFNREPRLARPYGMGRMMESLWQIAEQEQRNKIMSCPNNSGLDRIKIGIIYMQADEMTAMIDGAKAAAKKAAEDTSGKL